MKKTILFIFLCISLWSQAQVGINTTNPEAQLDIKSSNQALPSNKDGLLIPKIDAFPATNPTVAQQGMLVYLTTTVGVNVPGFYYWNNSPASWLPLKGNNGSTLDQAYDFGGAGIGKTITADAGAVLIDGTDGFVSTGTLFNGAIAPSGAGVKMFWNPRKAAFRAGSINGTEWNDANIGFSSTAFGFNNIASGSASTALGSSTTAIGNISTSFGSSTTAIGSFSTAFGQHNIAQSYGETVIGIGATNYTPLSTTNNFIDIRAQDRLFVIGNANDVNGTNNLDEAERSDAMIVLKSGLTRLPSTTNTMITAADGKAVVTKEYLQTNTSGTLDQAYDFGGAGLGKTITADAGAVLIDGTDGLVSTGTLGSGAIAPSGGGVKIFWNPRKAAFRVGEVSGTQWDDANIGIYSSAFGTNTKASGSSSIAFGNNSTASGIISTAFGSSTIASGRASTTLGTNNVASGFASSAFGESNTAPSFGETVIGIGATNYSPLASGTTFLNASPSDRLFVIGNAVDINGTNTVDIAERSDAMIVLKSGLTRLPSTTNAMITAADGKAVVTKEYLQTNTSGTLDQAYDFGGAGLGKTITADAGAVLINGTDGFVSTGSGGSGAVAPSGGGAKMFWNPRKTAFRSGFVFGTTWDDVNIGYSSVAFGQNTIASGVASSAFGANTTASGSTSCAFGGGGTTASGVSSTALGNGTTASGFVSTSFGIRTTASGDISTALGNGTTASGLVSTSFGIRTTASGDISTAFGEDNIAASYGETVIGIGATEYIPSTNGTTQYRTANATDRLFVIGNAIDANNDGNVDAAERRNAMVVLKNGNTGFGTSTPTRNLHVSNNSASTTNGQLYLEQSGTGDALMHIGNTGARHFNLGLDTSADSFKIGTSASAATAVTTGTLMTLLPTGQVGIGTTNPLENLVVSGPAGQTVMRIANTSTTASTSGVALEFFRASNALTDWRIFTSGASLLFGRSVDDFSTVNNLYELDDNYFAPATDNTQSLGRSGVRWSLVYASNGFINTSDIRQKKNIQNLNYGLTDLMKLRPVSFEWKKDDGSGTKLGLIAQELQKVIPEVVRDWDWQEDDQGSRKKVEAPIMGVFYSDLIPVLIKSIQEQQAIIEKQKEENNSLKNQLESQSKTINTILNRLEKLENK